MDQEANTKAPAARAAVDQAIVRLWLAMRDLSDCGLQIMAEEDFNLWSQAANHSGMLRAGPFADLPTANDGDG